MKKIQIFVFGVFFLLFISCKKSMSDLTFKANGIVTNPTTNIRISNYPISLYWYNSAGLWPIKINIETVKTASDGTFSISTNIDTSKFSKGFSLVLSLDASGGYILNAFGINAKVYILKSNYDPSAYKDIEFNVYKNANLKLKLIRTQTDTFTGLEVLHSILIQNNYYNDYSIFGQNPPPNTEINISTISDAFTKIFITKYNGTPNIVFKLVDSVKCTSDSTSILNVYY